MSMHKLFHSTFLVVLFSVALGGCATYGKSAGGGSAGDTAITTSVRTLLDQHPELGAPHSIEVQTIDGVVYLNGQVEAGLERHIAESVALQAPGVLKVVNSIAVAR